MAGPKTRLVEANAGVAIRNHGAIRSDGNDGIGWRTGSGAGIMVKVLGT